MKLKKRAAPQHRSKTQYYASNPQNYMLRTILFLICIFINAKPSFSFPLLISKSARLTNDSKNIKNSIYKSFPSLSSAAKDPRLNTASNRQHAINSAENTSEGMASRDEKVENASILLRRLSWFSWWTQVILTTVSSVTLIFAKSVSAGPNSMLKLNGFFLAGSGLALSFLSIVWTWGGARLARRLLRLSTTRKRAAKLLRRAVNVQVGINVLGMFVTLLGAEQIVGLLAAKSLTSSQALLGGGNALASAYGQVLQPLDILVVQANTNTLFSHFVSLASKLWFMRYVIEELEPVYVD